jgi:GT2 family glycosyltransferase
VSRDRDDLATLAVLLVNYGTHALLEQNLEHSLGPDFPGRVVVVDNLTTHEEQDAMAAGCARHGWDFLPLPSNEGFGGGMNRAADHAIRAGATELLLVNPDAWLEPETVARLREQVANDRRLLLAPRVERPDGRLYSDENDLYLEHGWTLWTRLRPADVREERVHTWVSGACLAMSTDLWQACGGFDEDYFLYWEDVDLSRRVVEAGGRVRVDPTLRAVHDEGSSQRTPAEGSGAKSPTYFYYNARNRLLYATKHVGPEDRRRWVRATPRLAYELAKQGGRRQFRRPQDNLWPVARGAWHGLREVRRSR